MRMPTSKQLALLEGRLAAAEHDADYLRGAMKVIACSRHVGPVNFARDHIVRSEQRAATSVTQNPEREGASARG